MKKILFISLFSVALFSCSEDDDNKVIQPKEELLTVTFEGAAVAEDGTLQGTSYTEAGIVFENYYDEQYFYNSGYTVSKCTDKETSGFMNQYSVYADGGAEGSEKFAIYNPCSYSDCYIHRTDNADFEPAEMQVAMTTYTWLSTNNGDSYSKKFGEGDSYTMTVKGLDAAGNELKSLDVKLVDFPTWWTPWRGVSLRKLGKVNKIFISFTSTDMSEWGMNTPAYVAIDNFTFVKGNK